MDRQHGPNARNTSQNQRKTSPQLRAKLRLGTSSFHAGLDFTAYRGAPILAAAPGRVVYAGRRSGYGRTVEIDHGYGFKTRYGHLNSIDVRYGDVVEEGQKIGGMGNTGRSTATHLHFEVMFRDRHVDPANFLRAGRYVQ